MSSQLLKHVQNKSISHLAIVGMAKNTGKTVTLNRLVQEGVEAGLQLALISYGHDGEMVDSVTLKDKPPIKIPYNGIFVTSQKMLRKSSMSAQSLSDLGISTVLGSVNIYQNKGRAEQCELIGVNSTNTLQEAMKKIENYNIDLIIVDGALDRKSSAVPELTQGFILATGATVANNEEQVVHYTAYELEKLMLPEVTDCTLKSYAHNFFESDTSGVVLQDGTLKFINFPVVKHLKKLLDEFTCQGIMAVILQGAFTNRIFELLYNENMLSKVVIIVKDPTKIFLSSRNLKIIKKQNIQLQVCHRLTPVAVTVNPIDPTGRKLDSSVIIKELSKRMLDSIPILDLVKDLESKDFKASVD